MLAGVNPHQASAAAPIAAHVIQNCRLPPSLRPDSRLPEYPVPTILVAHQFRLNSSRPPKFRAFITSLSSAEMQRQFFNPLDLSHEHMARWSSPAPQWCARERRVFSL